MVTVGRIVRPQHNRGEVLVVSETDFAEDRFAVGSTLYREQDGRVEPLVVVTSREHDGRWVVGFRGVESINDADALRGLELRVAGDDLKPLAADTYYLHDLVGCVVSTSAGPIGPVVRVDVGVGIPMLVIDGDGEVLVPFTSAMCRRVDVDARTIEIDPPEGLVELNRAKRP
jgi:16S rRNA processing protein RimM